MHSRHPQGLYLGIDTGGTFTDAVILDPASGRVLASKKSLTTRYDLKVGLLKAIRRVMDELPPGLDAGHVRMVSISTTLATNALVEGEGSAVAALFIGYEQSMIAKSRIREKLNHCVFAPIAGGHDSAGLETTPLDEAAVANLVAEHGDHVDAFAVSATFSVRNPAHELRAREIIAGLSDKPVTCGHELTSALDAPRRALTTALNASLISRIRRLILAVQECMQELAIEAPLMVVKGDGTIMAAKVARRRPIETILSGPAASMIGAQALCGLDDFILSDMGGTTTDIGVLLDGRVKLNPHGAEVGGARTMVQAIDLHTFALGGDSLVDIDRDRKMVLGPRRAIPISLLGESEVIRRKMEGQLNNKDPVPFCGWFAVLQQPDAKLENFEPKKREIIQILTGAPCALEKIIVSPSFRRHLFELCRDGVVSISGFTPTDALHVLNEFNTWSREAAVLGAALMLRWRFGKANASDAQLEAFCREVKSAVQEKSSHALLKLALRSSHTGQSRERLSGIDAGEPFPTLVSRGVNHVGLANLNIALSVPVVAVGAPVAAYYPEVGRRLGCPTVMPEHFEVANAVGAVSGLVIQTSEILISRPDNGAYRVHLVDELRELGSWHQALALARETAGDYARAGARTAGADHTKVVHSLSKIHLPGTSGDEGIIEATVKAEAIGRPASVV